MTIEEVPEFASRLLSKRGALLNPCTARARLR